MELRAILAVLFLQAATASAATDDQDIEVIVKKVGESLEMTVSLQVSACRDDVWRVLTDYNGMVQFVSTLESSAIVRQVRNDLDVAQKGKLQFGLLTFPFSNVRHIELDPKKEIRSRIVEGAMKTSHFVTSLQDDDGAIRIVQHGQVVPDMWVPPWIGPTLIAAGTRKQWQEFRAEIIRRKPSAGAYQATDGCR